jgi:hypothetical protein
MSNVEWQTYRSSVTFSFHAHPASFDFYHECDFLFHRFQTFSIGNSHPLQHHIARLAFDASEIDMSEPTYGRSNSRFSNNDS